MAESFDIAVVVAKFFCGCNQLNQNIDFLDQMTKKYTIAEGMESEGAKQSNSLFLFDHWQHKAL